MLMKPMCKGTTLPHAGAQGRAMDYRNNRSACKSGCMRAQRVLVIVHYQQCARGQLSESAVEESTITKTSL